MNDLDLPPLSTERATVEVADAEGGALRLRFRGTIDQLQPGEFLDPLFDRLHHLALEKRLATIEADVTELSFLNSSGIRSLANWVKRQMALPREERYPIKFIYSDQVTWQRATLKALLTMARGSVLAEVRTPG